TRAVAAGRRVDEAAIRAARLAQICTPEFDVSEELCGPGDRLRGLEPARPIRPRDGDLARATDAHRRGQHREAPDRAARYRAAENDGVVFDSRRRADSTTQHGCERAD